MTGFEFYAEIREAVLARYPDTKECPLSDEELAGLIKNCKKHLRGNCGEHRRLSRPETLKAYLDFLRRDGEAVITCGKMLYGDENGVNPAITALEEAGFLGKQATYCYMPYNPLEQVAEGFIHAFIFDGETVFVESPHGYCSDDCEECDSCIQNKGLLFKDKEIADLLERWTKKYTDSYALKEDYLGEMKKNTLPVDHPEWTNPDCHFNTKENFDSIILS